MDNMSELSASAFKRRILEAQGPPALERQWNLYPKIFNLTKNLDWKDKRILDVGSGIKIEDPQDTFPGATVYALDPELSIDGNVGQIYYNSATVKRLGIVQEIPADDNHFDLILSSHAVPRHILPLYMGVAVSEMLRVMKPTGEIRLTPCLEIDLSSIRNTLVNSGFDVDLSQRGTEGTIAIIRLNETLRCIPDHKQRTYKKIEAWKKFHDDALPEDALREDFDALEIAKKNSA